jgi:hypothetical protein
MSRVVQEIVTGFEGFQESAVLARIYITRLFNYSYLLTILWHDFAAVKSARLIS